MVMLGSARDGEAESLYSWTTPRELGGVTACIYVVVPDADAHCLHARNEGAVVVSEPHDNDGYPGRGYEALDPEGNVWSFGTYDPWAHFAYSSAASGRPTPSACLEGVVGGADRLDCELHRSVERRVGKECVSPFSTRGG